MEWTFDPLEIKNSYFNLERLGVICRRYHVDFYGPSSSPLQGGLPYRSPPRGVVAALRSRDAAASAKSRPEEDLWTAVYSNACRCRAWCRHGSSLRRLAGELDRFKRTVQSALEAAFARGLAVVTGYSREADGSGAFLLGIPPPDASIAHSRGRDLDVHEFVTTPAARHA